MAKAANAKTNGHTVPELKTAAPKKAAPRKPAVKKPAPKPAVKTAVKAAARPAVKAVARKPAAKPAVKAVPKPPAKKAAAVKPAAPAEAVKSAAPAVEKTRKAKLVRDSFTMPEQEYAVLGQVKKACIKAGFEIKKSELLRIGVALISQLDLATLKSVLADLPQLKTGRPKND